MFYSKIFQIPGQARLLHSSFLLPISILSDLEGKYTLLIAALNDAARTQLRKAASDDLNNCNDNTNIHTHPPTAGATAPLRKKGKKMVTTRHS